MALVRIHIHGSLLCEASGLDDSEAFDAVLDAVLADSRVHRAQVESLEIQSLEGIDASEGSILANDGPDLSFSEFEDEHGLEILDCGTWPDDLVKDLVPFLDAWSKGKHSLEDYELLQMARGLGLLALGAEDSSQEELTDRGNLMVMGWRVAQKAKSV